MCGICGAVQVGGEPRQVLPDGVLERMTSLLEHRGPDDSGYVEEPGIALGARRLSIVDLDGGHQPVASEDGRVWAAQNGELYNHVELRMELRRDGHVLRSRCDTEILPHLYERDGVGFETRLRGKFAIAVWDERRRRAVLVRDRLGVKPLYWAQCGDVVVFSSELKSLLASGLVEPELDLEAIDSYLTFGFVSGPATPLRGVRKLLPGHRLVVDPAGVREERYWTYPRPEPDESLTDEEWSERLLGELDEAVRIRLMSDVPLGAMLSGGLDSSLIVALMARHSTDPVRTFSVGFAEAGTQSELADAREVASLYGCEHHELELSVSDRELDLADLIWWLDEPLADLSALGFLSLCKLATRHVTVALCGQGADELLGGYRKHRASELVDAWRRLPAPARRTGAAAALHGPRRFRRAAETLAAPDAATRLVAMSGHMTPALRRSLYAGGLARVDGDAALAATRRCLGGYDGAALDSTLYVDGQLALVDDMLHYFDRASMAHSLEARVPFLDHNVVELCARVPRRLKVHRGETKVLLRRAARGLVPDRIIDKPKLGFFRPAFDSWFLGQAEGAVADYLLAANPRYADFLDPAAVRGLVARHVEGRDRSHLHLLLAILMLEVWLTEYLPRAVRAPSAVVA
jgi:asparagine synthase (glutamine-hydrolysing)